MVIPHVYVFISETNNVRYLRDSNNMNENVLMKMSDMMKLP